MDTFEQILNIVGFFIRAGGFILLGFGVARFTLDAYYKAAWQVQIALSAGFFLLLVGLTKYSSPASMGMFALGSGAAFVMQFMGKKEEEEVKEGKKK
ncbi:MAG: hypothetical protein KPEEDBHJ_02209 [Anaerolineales bacterium]|nr:hypothetical protein [Anaerolineales bacterium]